MIETAFSFFFFFVCILLPVLFDCSYSIYMYNKPFNFPQKYLTPLFHVQLPLITLDHYQLLAGVRVQAVVCDQFEMAKKEKKIKVQYFAS